MPPYCWVMLFRPNCGNLLQLLYTVLENMYGYTEEKNLLLLKYFFCQLADKQLEGISRACFTVHAVCQCTKYSKWLLKDLLETIKSNKHGNENVTQIREFYHEKLTSKDIVLHIDISLFAILFFVTVLVV